MTSRRLFHPIVSIARYFDRLPTSSLTLTFVSSYTTLPQTTYIPLLSVPLSYVAWTAYVYVRGCQILLSDIGVLAAGYGLYISDYCSQRTLMGVTSLRGSITCRKRISCNDNSTASHSSLIADWLRGALATVDRNYGILNKVFHHIAHTHVLHHLISSIPHYHSQEASEAIKPILGDYYHYDDTPFYEAMWREAKECLYVEAEEDGDKTSGVYWYKNKLRVSTYIGNSSYIPFS